MLQQRIGSRLPAFGGYALQVHNARLLLHLRTRWDFVRHCLRQGNAFHPERAVCRALPR